MLSFNGIINVNKPKGITSYDVIRKLKRILKTSKIGHTGTLDPLAEGVMIICVGKATKLADNIESEKKVYTAGVLFGAASDTYDLEGRIIKENKDYQINKDSVENCIKKYIGEIEQVPPMYSAIKINGQKLYDLARKGIEVERKSRKVEIDYIEIDSFSQSEMKITTKVSKGTYIRSLVNDIGEDLGCFALMNSLVRRAVGEYKIEDSYTLEEMEAMGNEGDYSFVITIEQMYKEHPIYAMNDLRVIKLFENGNEISNINLADNIYRVYINEEFSGLASVENSVLKGYKYF